MLLWPPMNWSAYGSNQGSACVHPGRGNQALGREIVQALHPEYMSQIFQPRIVVHDVFGHWPGEMFAYAYADLRKNHNITLSSTNVVYLKE
jgi:hypothetical protein